MDSNRDNPSGVFHLIGVLDVPCYFFLIGLRLPKKKLKKLGRIYIHVQRGGVDDDNWFFPVFVEPQAFLRQKYEDATIAFALEERQLACFGRQPRSGDGHRELERQKQFSPDTMITMK